MSLSKTKNKRILKVESESNDSDTSTRENDCENSDSNNKIHKIKKKAVPKKIKKACTKVSLSVVAKDTPLENNKLKKDPVQKIIDACNNDNDNDNDMMTIGKYINEHDTFTEDEIDKIINYKLIKDCKDEYGYYDRTKYKKILIGDILSEIKSKTKYKFTKSNYINMQKRFWILL